MNAKTTFPPSAPNYGNLFLRASTEAAQRWAEQIMRGHRSRTVARTIKTMTTAEVGAIWAQSDCIDLLTG